jgi:uncharacterized membrane protein YagU involved in acid resistance
MSGVMLIVHRLGAVDKASPRVITEKALSVVADAPESVVQTSTRASHFGYGTAAGAAFGVIAPRMPGPRWLRGIAFATGLMLLSYEGWVPALGILPPLHGQSVGRKASLIVGHLVYGGVLGTVAG